LSVLDRQNLRADALGSHVRENAAFQIQGSLSFFIERMHRHDAALATFANENSRHRTIDKAGRMNDLGVSRHRAESVPRVSVKDRRGIKPAAAGRVEEPSTIVIGGPAPRLIADPSGAEKRIRNPLAICERGPAKPDTERPPTVSISAAIGKGAIGIQVGESRSVIRGTGILQRRSRCSGNTFDTAGDPAVEVVLLWKAAHVQ
jgi:hypothetical protein